jgi:hypothetical protein
MYSALDSTPTVVDSELVGAHVADVLVAQSGSFKLVRYAE